MAAVRCNLSLINGTLGPRDHLPTHEAVDYAEIAMLVVLLVTGLPLNVSACVRLLGVRKNPCDGTGGTRAQRGAVNRGRTITRASTLELNLTIANLLIICLYGLSQICWLSTYSWLGGDVLCRLVKFCDTFCFYTTSNIVAVIAIDRVQLSARVDQPTGRRYSYGRYSYDWTLNAALAIAWTLAFVCSVPQLLIWRVYTPYACEHPNWQQCVSVWMARRDSSPDDERMEQLYTGAHLLFVFWAPLLIILFSYALIFLRLREKIALNIRDTRLQQRTINAITFRRRATSFHRRSVQADEARLTPAAHEGRPSAGSLAAVPIVIDCSHAFVCQPVLASSAVKTLTRAQRRTVTTAFWIVLAYLLCWSPYNTLVLCRYLDQSFDNRILEFSSNLIVLNAVLNPLIYKMK